MSLSKIPFILAFAYAFHFSGSPPAQVALAASTMHDPKHNSMDKKTSWFEYILAIAGPLLKVR